jgi:ribosome-associated toxin RatA of RatAB toxin-antitoxin module
MSRSRRVALSTFFCAFSTFYGPSASARPRLDQDRLSALARYDVLAFADPFQAGLDRGKAIGVIDATTEEVFRVATDYAKYQDFMPRVRSSVVTEQPGPSGEAHVRIAAELPWPAGMSWVEAQYHAQTLPGQIYRVSFDMVKGNLRRYLGSLYIEPWSTGKSAITYEIVAEPDLLAPRSAVNRGIKRSASKFVHALRQRINELHRLGYLHPVIPPPGGGTPQSLDLLPSALKAKR